MSVILEATGRHSDEQLPNAASYAALISLAGFVLIYLPGVGHGFVNDDFAWILHSRLDGTGDVWRIFTEATNFYRPIVSLSFGLTYSFVGVQTFWYGLTNVLLCVLAAWSVGRFGSALGLSYGTSVVAAATWAFDFHGINMAVLWNSGRTALFLTLFSVLAATSFVERRHVRATAWVLLALLSKEEAVVLPLVLTIWAVIERTEGYTLGRVRQAIRRTAGTWLCLAVYILIRSGTDAFTPSTAPPFYQFEFSASRFMANGLQYLDRAATFPASVVVLGWIVMKSRPMVLLGRHRVIALAVVWLILGYAPTMFLPVRSSLYACLPSVGSSLAAGVLLSGSWHRADAKRRRLALWLALAFPFVLWPVYNARNDRWVELADLSHAVMPDLTKAALATPDGATLLLLDDRSTRVNLASAFGTLLSEAVALFSGRTVRIWVEPPLPEAALAGLPRPRAEEVSVALELRGARLMPLRKDLWKPD